MRFTCGMLLAMAAAPAFAGGPVTPVSEIELIAPAAVAPPTPFAGYYAGVDLGYGFKGDDVVGVAGTQYGDLELGGALANLHVGWRWQPGIYVWGVELGVEGGDVQDDTADASTEMKYAATLRAISGWTPREDTLVYGFAGVSHGEFDYAISPLNYDDSFSRTGYVVGFGAERLLNDRWSVRGEYQYSDYGKETLDTVAGTTNATPKFHSVRVGMNYRF